MTTSRVLCFGFLIAMATASLSWTPPARAADAPEKAESEMCGGHLTRLRGTELAKALTSVHLSIASDLGVCPDGIRISTWLLELRSDGQYTLWLDRGYRYGSYSFKDDQLCMDTTTRCANFYRDEAGRMYMFGGPNPSNVPTLLNHMTVGN